MSDTDNSNTDIDKIVEGIVAGISRIPQQPHSGLFCLQCVGMFLGIRNKITDQEAIKESRRMAAHESVGESQEEYVEPDFSDLPVYEIPGINEAITLAPMWQQQPIGPQMAFACVAVPSCMEHLNSREVTPEEKAVQGGLLLGRPTPSQRPPWGGN
jgi:hypothetical protein